MQISNHDLLEEFYKEQKDKYPELTLEEFKEICISPWQAVKQEMETGLLPTIRLKYFGTFQVYEGRARNMLHNLKRRIKFHKMDKKEYTRLSSMIENFLNEIKK